MSFCGTSTNSGEPDQTPQNDRAYLRTFSMPTLLFWRVFIDWRIRDVIYMYMLRLRRPLIFKLKDNSKQVRMYNFPIYGTVPSKTPHPYHPWTDYDRSLQGFQTVMDKTAFALHKEPVATSDESRFTISNADYRRLHIYRRRNVRLADCWIRERHRFGGGSIMVWGGIGKSENWFGHYLRKCQCAELQQCLNYTMIQFMQNNGPGISSMIMQGLTRRVLQHNSLLKTTSTSFIGQHLPGHESHRTCMRWIRSEGQFQIESPNQYDKIPPNCASVLK